MMKSFASHRNLWSAAAAVIVTAVTVAHGYATEAGADAKGKQPAGEVIHLRRLGADVDKPWLFQLFQNSIDVKPDADYVLTFWAKASATFNLGVSTKVSAPPWAFFGLRDTVQLTPDWRIYTMKFNAKGAVSGETRLAFSFATPSAGEVWIADISLKRADQTPGSKDNVVSNPQFEDGFAQWYVDGKQDGVFDADVQTAAEANSGTKK